MGSDGSHSWAGGICFAPGVILRLPNNLLGANCSKGEGMSLHDGKVAEIVFFKSSVYFCFSTPSIPVCGSCVLNDFLVLNFLVSVLLWTEGLGRSVSLALVSLKCVKKAWECGLLLVPWKRVPEKNGTT